MFVKKGESTKVEIKSTDAVLEELDTSVLDQFRKTASELKKIAPKAKDFLYFSAIMMHAAEAALIDDDGNIKKDASGNDIISKWLINEKTGSWKWECTDKSIKPVKNSNGDIFPESELKTAYKKWVGKPLCIDHKSSSVDHIRGVIVDTYYDDKLKRVIGLCALDKINYPDLARKVSTGYSASVSMGTGVSCAVCYDCGKAARVESDFCDHMRNKSCYGEINTGLSPIELSIVVNGADPKAKIRHIVAAADSIAKYVDQKEENLKTSLSSGDFKQLEKDLEKAQESLNKLKEGLSEFKDEEELENDSDSKDEDKNDAGTQYMAETDLENTDRNFNLPQRFAEENDLNTSDQKFIIAKLDVLEEKINNFINKMASIEKTNIFSEETDMVNEKKAYFQGAGDVNEPTPGKPKYPKEDNESIREKEDKQMLVDNTGGTDGLFPGDEAKKKELQRAAEIEQRALRRQAALKAAKETLKKKSYFQGGGDVNEPTPGKPKYTKEDGEKVREKEDKQMVGASPFPGVGKTEGLYGDDLKKKELLNRASLVARFIKAANADGSDNAANSGWQVYSKTDSGERLILTATVGDIAGDKAEVLYNSIATKDFGKNIINTIKTEGFDKAVKLFKGAQSTGLTPVTPSHGPAQPTKEEVDVAEGHAALHNGEYPADFVKKYPTYRAGMKSTAQAVPAMPSAGPGAPPDAAMTPEMPSDSDKGNSGDPVEQVDTLLGEMDGLTADMKKAVEALKEEDTSDLDGSASPSVTASTSLPNMRKTLNGALQKGAKQAIAEMQDHIEELNLIKHVHQKSASINSEDAEFVKNVISEAISDAKTTTANVYKLMSAFVKYAQGTDALIKKATEEAKMNKSAQESPNPNEDWKKTIEDLKKVNPATSSPESKFEAKAPQAPKPGELQPIFEVNDMDKNDAVKFEVDSDGKVKGTADSLSEIKASEEFDLNTSEGRAQMRAKIAQKGLKFSDMLGKAHPKGSVVVPGLDFKPTGDSAQIEDLEDAHDKIMSNVEKATPKVRQAAEQIQKLVVAGRINPEKDFDGLIAQGLDSDAVSYWKKFWGEAKDGGSQFASELVKANEKKKIAEEAEKVRVKTARAYELAYDMVERGIISSNREAIAEQVNDILTWSDANFEHLKKVIANKPQVKTASALPVVGSPIDSMIGGHDFVLPGVSNSNNDLKTLLESAFATSGRSKR